ncbi:cbb3-type cytochrome oxidase assembly protein CcoS [Hydrogenimonas sp.]|uniref:cbb3-type cytochrome oxidase assembly protein CcoS n=1 Tax=Hydrogenimonas sp. TaxID=2231112 RepID=UPI00262DB629|nr:cbb3-type cytochrome oxidase assembly protein CcoS [Hydrogenimonas sp.]
MSSGILAMMLGVSTLLGAFGLFALLWGHKTGQFEDKHKFLDGALYDGEEELKDAVMMQKKREEIEKKKRDKRREDKRVMPD